MEYLFTESSHDWGVSDFTRLRAPLGSDPPPIIRSMYEERFLYYG